MNHNNGGYPFCLDLLLTHFRPRQPPQKSELSLDHNVQHAYKPQPHSSLSFITLTQYNHLPSVGSFL